ncbi:MAG: DUF4347 domain-containing protein, partial [Deltaproteobacteria bacterium]|nr:DUF4347 domain-containing protein [Deltaproteobacteria bacterium]
MLPIKRITKGLRSLSQRFRKGNHTSRRKIEFEALEPRLLLSADPVASSQDLQESTVLSVDPVAPLVEYEDQAAPVDTAASDNQSGGAETTAHDPGEDATAEQPVQEDKARLSEDTESADVSSDDTSREDAANSDETAAENTDQQAPQVVDENGSAGSAETITAQQAAYLAARDSGREIIIIDPSVPDYETLLDRLAEDEEDDSQDTVQADPQDESLLNHVQSSTDEGDSREDILADPAEVDDEGALVERAIDDSDDDGSSENSLYDVVILDADRNGLEQISDILERYQGISAVHIISHGAIGTLRLGSSIIDRDRLEEYSESLKAWKEAMAEGGDVLLYGCNIADGDYGIEFVQDLSSLTGADVAASTDDTGNVKLGGNWRLEFTTGLIETYPLFHGSTMEGYGYLLEDIAGTDDDDTLTGNQGVADSIYGGAGDDTYTFQDGWGSDSVLEYADEGIDTLNFSAVTDNLTFTINSDGSISVTDGTNTLTSVANIEKIIGGSGSDTIIGPSGGATWNLTGDNTGIVNGLIFSGIDNLKGSDTGADNFIIENNARWSGEIDGGGGANTLSAAPVSADLLFSINEDGTVSVSTAPDTWSSLGI